MRIGTRTAVLEPIDDLEKDQVVPTPTEATGEFTEEKQVLADGQSPPSPSAAPVRKGKVIKKFKGLPPNAKEKDCEKVESFKHMGFPFEYFNPIQTDFLPEVEKDNNIVVCGTTSAGKTVIAEMVIAYTLGKGREKYPVAKAAYVCPLKALAFEKEQDWTGSGHSFYQYNISILTGDYILTSERKAELSVADIICMSSEMLGSRIRRDKAEHNTWLTKDMRVCVIDEAHLLSTQERGDKLEAAIMKFTKVNPDCRIIFLSATMPNVEDLGGWLTKLNGKKTTIVRSDYRPVELSWHFELFRAEKYYAVNERNKIDKAIDVINRYSKDKFIVFVHGKKTGKKILDKLRGCGISSEFHNADLVKEKRQKIEASFRSQSPNSLRIIVATSTLAWGINMPARRVLIAGIHRGMNLIDSLDIPQEGGRAGRVGLDKQGDVHVLIRDSHRNMDISFCKQVEPIVSKIADINALAFHLVSEIAERNVETPKDAQKWYERSLAHHQRILDEDYGEDIIEKVVEQLQMCGAIAERKDKKLYATYIGKVASWFYFSPFDVADWSKNLKKVLKKERPKSREIAWALGNTFSAKQGYEIPLDDVASKVLKDLHNQDSLYVDNVAARNVYLWYCVLIGKEPKRSDLAAATVGFKMDGPRVAQSISVLGHIGKTFADLPGKNVLLELPYRMTYGLGNKGIEMLLLPGVGRKTALQIMETRRMHTCKELIAAQTIGQPVFSKEKWDKVKDIATEIARVGYIEYLKRKNKRK